MRTLLRTRLFGSGSASWSVSCAALVFAAGCGMGRVTSSETESVEGSSSSVSVSLHGDEQEAALARGKQAALEGRYEDAVGILSRVAENRSAKSEIREQALFQLGEIFTNVLNPRRDADRAREYFQALIDGFPDSKLRPEAQGRIEALPSTE